MFRPHLSGQASERVSTPQWLRHTRRRKSFYTNTLRVWRNWQTRRIQVPVSVKDVEVQILSPALSPDKDLRQLGECLQVRGFRPVYLGTLPIARSLWRHHFAGNTSGWWRGPCVSWWIAIVGGAHRHLPTADRTSAECRERMPASHHHSRIPQRPLRSG